MRETKEGPGGGPERAVPRKKIAIGIFVSGLVLAVPLVAQVWEPGDPLPRDMSNREDEFDIPADDSVPSFPARPSPGRAEPRVLHPPPEPPPPAAREPDASPDTTTAEPPVPLAGLKAPVPVPQPLSVAEDPDDFRCTRAPDGKVAPVPAPFDQWLVLVCTQDGQALVPVEGEAWVARGSADIVSLFALPPGVTAPARRKDFDPRYDIRFVEIGGGEAAGERRERAISLLELATTQSETLPGIRDVWQLDAVSSIDEARYNSFFYRDGERPTRIIACLDRCMRALHLDVLSGAEAREVLGR